MYDVIIIGAGVCGASVARELSRYQLKVGVLEKAEDVCCGTSKANSGIVHAGYDAKPGTWMAKLNVSGNRMMEGLAKELDVPFERKGSLVIGRDEGDMPVLEELKKRGEANGVLGLEILSPTQVSGLEKHVTENVKAALFAPSAGIVCPFGLTIALAENAYTNGVEFYFNSEVTDIQKKPEGFFIQTQSGHYETCYIVNAAGVYADVIHNMVSEDKMQIIPRKGEYFLLDKSEGHHVSRTIFSLPGKYGKGVLVTPTVHGNLLVGPTAEDIEDKEGTSTTGGGLGEIRQKAGMNVGGLNLKRVITSFAGLRAHEKGHDFIIGEASDVPGFIDCAGIESPGLTSAPAIGRMIADIVKEKLNPKENTEFDGRRKGVLDPSVLSIVERNLLIKKDPAYGNIVCRCEMISEGEILDAIRRPLGARTLDGIKRRTRAGMGRCQSGFCSPRTMEILSRELGVAVSEIRKSGPDSKLIVGENKDRL